MSMVEEFPVFLGKVLSAAFDRLDSDEVKEFTHRMKVDGDLEKLKKKLPMIENLLYDADQKEITDPAVRRWLYELIHLAYDIDDLLDEVVTDARRSKLEEECSRSNKVQTLCSKFFNLWSNYKESGRIKELNERFDEVAKEMHNLGLINQGSSIRPVSLQRPLMNSFILDDAIFGMNKDVEKLLKLLLSDDDDDEGTGDHDMVSVIPIVGMGGIGKTTLAQLLYNREEVSKRFKLKVWVCVSDGKFDLIRVTRNILEWATAESFILEGLLQLQERLKKLFSNKKFLLVLDDVWSEVYNDWDRLQAPFNDGSRGSKIIVTTSSEYVSSMIGTVPKYRLRKLSEEDCQAVFNYHAYENESPDAYPELKPIGEEIVKKCKGLPLAAKTLGRLLRGKLSIAEWEDVLNSRPWDLSQHKHHVLPSLRSSYHNLPAHLKQCFSYCTIFPKDYEFNKKQLILLWMAEGFLQPRGNEIMEDIGDEYFSELLSRSLFQRSSSNESRYVMHDLNNDLAHYFSRGICFSFKDKWSEVDMSLIRYTSVPYSGCNTMAEFEAFDESKSLRTLLIISHLSLFLEIPKRLPHYLISKLPCLRVMCFNNCVNLYELPESIGNLKHLRYLDLSKTSIERLPESVSTLLNLQTLVLSNCESLVKLLTDMGNLTNLRHLYIDECNNLQEMPLGIYKMTNLQTLSMFAVGESSQSRIEELSDVNQLREKLSIIRLENVVNIYNAILVNKEHLDELDLNWSFPLDNYGTNSEIDQVDSEDCSVELAVINELQPHRNLKRLTVSWYYGTRFPDWLGYSSYSNLLNLELIDCRRCQLLPPLGCLPSLKNLQIKGLWKVKTVGSEFYGGILHTSKRPFQSLKTLVFEDMKDWDEWSGIEEEREEEFPCLIQLEIINCPKLRKFSHRFVKLEELKIQQCGELTTLPSCLPVLSKLHVRKCNEMVFRSVVDSTPPPLAFLSISEISNLKNLMLPLEQEEERRSLVGPLNALRELVISNCNELVKLSLSNEVRRGSQRLASLRSLDISLCPQLVCLSDDEDVLPLKFLTQLTIKSCQNLHFFKFLSLPKILGIDSTCLEKLTIHDCPGLVSFPKKMELPSKLRDLEIKGCKNLNTFPEQVRHNSDNNKDPIFLDRLRMSDCDSLISFTRSGSSSGGVPLFPRHLEIWNCPNLASLPEVMMYNNWFLEVLEIGGCNKLTSFPSSGRCLGGFDPCIVVVADNMNDDLPLSQDKRRTMTSVLPTTNNTITNVKTIIIHGCNDLKSLPDSLYKLTSLQSLDISSCSSLVSFPAGGIPITSTLTSFTIYECEKLMFLPDGLHNGMSLRDLSICRCPNLDPFPRGGFPGNLESLDIRNCGKQKCVVEWGLHNLISLKSLTIGGFSGPIWFPDCLLPPNLTLLSIEHLPDLQFLPERFRSLTSLRELKIKHCDELTSFPEKGLPSSLERLFIRDCEKLASFPEKGLASSLGSLQIVNCPMLKERCEKEKGKDWTKIADIPLVAIDYKFQ